MKYIPALGISAPELDWVPSPTFALRRQAVLDRVSKWRRGSVLEVGCGSGAILYDMALLGFTGVGVETSEPARQVAESILQGLPSMAISACIPGKSEQYDYLLSFEVLEHIEDDLAALTDWVKHLNPGGICLISVPAHPSHWNLTDVMAGHYRRYARREILGLIASAGLTPHYVATYGWPATWIIERVRNWVRKRQLAKQGFKLDAVALGDPERTARSGIERSIEARLFPYYSGLLGRGLFASLAGLQRAFYKSDRGISYLIEARKL